MQTAEATSAPKVDGRRLRAVRTRERIIMAVRELADEGATRAPVTSIARRAGVSTRSIFQHWDSIASVRFEALTGDQIGRIAGGLRALSDADLVRHFLNGEMS